MNGTPISSANNPTFQLQQKVLSNKKYRRKEGLIWLEGARAISQCPQDKIKALFLGPKAPLQDWPVPPYILNTELAKLAFDTDSPQEVGCLLHWNGNDLKNCQWEKGVLILDGLQDPGNVGTLLRTAAAMDCGGFILLDSVELGNPKLLRSSAGSLFAIPAIEFHDRQWLQEHLKELGVQCYLADAGGKAKELSEPTGPFAMIVGSEGHGLGEGWKGHIWSLDLANGIESLNASVAGALMIRQLKKQQ